MPKRNLKSDNDTEPPEDVSGPKKFDFIDYKVLDV